MKDYELAYLLNPNLKDEEISQWNENYKSFIISDLNGEIKKEIGAKKRKLAYPIKKQLFAYFGVIYFSASPEKIAVLDKKIKIDGNALRYLLLQVDRRKQKELLKREKDLLEKVFRKHEPKIEKMEIPEKPKVGLEELDKKIEEILK